MLRSTRLGAITVALGMGRLVAAQTSTVLWGSVMECNAEDEGALRPRIVINGNGDPVVLWGDNSPMANHVSVGVGGTFSAPVEVSAGFMPSVDDWMGSSIAGVGNTLWVVMKSAPEEGSPIYVRRSDDGGFTWGDTIRVEPYDGLVSRFPSIDVADPDAPVVQYMQFDSGFSGARQVVTHMMGGSFMTPVQVSTPFAPGDVCDCCPNQVVADEQRVAALYRNAGGNIRVMWAATSNDGGSSFPVGTFIDTTGWVLAACPSSGPDGYIFGDSLRSVWMSGANNGGKVYVGSAALADLSLAQTIEVHGGQASNLQQNFPRIAGSGDTLGVVWQQAYMGQNEILFSWSTSGVNGLSAPDTVNVDLAGVQKTPDITYADGVFHIIWSEANTGQVRYRKATLGTNVGVLPIMDVDGQSGLWPNPSPAMMHVPQGYRNASVYGSDGRAVLSGVAVVDGTLDISSLPSGLYSIVLHARDRSRAFGRFVKQ